MNDIYDLKILTSMGGQDDLARRAWEYVCSMQKQGHHCEIQYQMTATPTYRHSVLITVRRA